MTQRNDQCPCGSGKKFKRCCLKKPAPPVVHAGEVDGRARPSRRVQLLVLGAEAGLATVARSLARR
jgi:hypothetical protein